MTTETPRIAILTGDTYRFRDRLKGAGWRWDPTRRAWTRPVNVDDTPEWIHHAHVHGVPGICNRGTFTVTIEG